MEKKIFIRDENMIKVCDIVIKSGDIVEMINKFKKITQTKLIYFAQIIITTCDSIEISKTIRKISEYNPNDNLEIIIKNSIIDSIIVKDIELNSILYSNSNENLDSRGILYLIKEKFKKRKSYNDSTFDDNIRYSSDFNDAIKEKVIQIELVNYKIFIFEEQLDNLLFSPTQIEEYKKRVVKSLPYTKKRRY